MILKRVNVTLHVALGPFLRFNHAGCNERVEVHYDYTHRTLLQSTNFSGIKNTSVVRIDRMQLLPTFTGFP